MNRTDQDFLNAGLRGDFWRFCIAGVDAQSRRAVLAELAHRGDRLRVGKGSNRGGDTVNYQLPTALTQIDHSLGGLSGLHVGPRSSAKDLWHQLWHGPRRQSMPATFAPLYSQRWYRQAFPKMQISRSADSDVYTISRGYRKATSVYATLTGLGGDCFIIDDPLKPIDAQSDAQRNHVNDWFSKYAALSTRQ